MNNVLILLNLSIKNVRFCKKYHGPRTPGGGKADWNVQLLNDFNECGQKSPPENLEGVAIWFTLIIIKSKP
jgi:hypothetical protein